ncbi:hypothetical protein WN51_02530 [Melipona quadrifasciata]|uniref:Uncharacterized protein n=1 Tax=Melipona quadrifasciata TaxID=166423 RepID=A0A0N1IT98_9HYME|nr:hypothetical protein WN51_02530 [Melipona quadrifasciata]
MPDRYVSNRNIFDSYRKRYPRVYYAEDGRKLDPKIAILRKNGCTHLTIDILTRMYNYCQLNHGKYKFLRIVENIQVRHKISCTESNQRLISSTLLNYSKRRKSHVYDQWYKFTSGALHMLYNKFVQREGKEIIFTLERRMFNSGLLNLNNS